MLEYKIRRRTKEKGLWRGMEERTFQSVVLVRVGVFEALFEELLHHN